MRATRMLVLCGAVLVGSLAPAVATAGAAGRTAAPSGPTGVLAATVKLVKSAPLTDFSPATSATRKAIASLLTTALLQTRSHGCAGALTGLQGVQGAIAPPAGGSGPEILAPLSSALQPQLLDARSGILASGWAADCGGVTTAPIAPPQPVSVTAPSDPAQPPDGQVRVVTQLPAVQFGHRVDPSGADYVSIADPAAGHVRGLGPGDPDLPASSFTVAMPQGTWPQVTVVANQGYSLPLPEQVYPLQASVADVICTGPCNVTPPAFAKNPDAYLSSQPLGGAPTAGDPVVQRGLQLATVAVPAASYVPATGLLQVFTSVTVDVTFCDGADRVTCVPNGTPGVGGTGATFGPETLVSPANAPFDNLWRATLANWAQVVSAPLTTVPVTDLTACGEQMMIITDPAYASEADTYATARTNDGVLTRVFPTSTTGTSLGQIHAAIAHEETGYCRYKPSYVLLFGSTTQIPTFEVTLPLSYWEQGSPPAGACPGGAPVATDQPFGFIHQWGSFSQNLLGAGYDSTCRTSADLTPDLFVGRIISPSSATVTKLITYNDSPSYLKANYASVTGAQFFQTSLSDYAAPFIPKPAQISTYCANPSNATSTSQTTNGFVQVSEFDGSLAQAAGKTYKRVNVADLCPGIVPATYQDGAPIPSALQQAGAWVSLATSTTQIEADIDAGSPFVWHADHGYDDGYGWANPQFLEGDLFHALPSGTPPPVLWSIDCDTGKFDRGGSQPGVIQSGGNFPDSALQGLAVGMVGSSRESPTAESGVLSESTARALFPEEGNVFRVLLSAPALQPVDTLGPLLEAAKLDEQGRNPSSWGAPLVALEYNVFGDPSLSIHRDTPSLVVPKKLLFSAATLTSGLVTVHIAAPTAKLPRNSWLDALIVNGGVVIGAYSGPSSQFTGTGGSVDFTLYDGPTGNPLTAADLNGARLTVGGDGMTSVSKVLSGF